MAKLADIQGVTIKAETEYGGVPIVFRVRANFLTPEMELRFSKLSDTSNEADRTLDDIKARNAEFAEILEGFIADWDIEDALPSKETFESIGILFMAKIAQIAMEAVSPGKGPATA